jgi:hypothetical protein
VVIAVREHDYVAGLEIDRRAIQQLRDATARGDEVVGNHMVGLGHEGLRDRARRRRNDRPGRLQLRLEEGGAGEPNRL